ncbi:MAG: amidase [Anaerolineae bacterium]
MLTKPAYLAEIAATLRGGQRDLLAYVEETCDRIEQVDPQVQALLPEVGRRVRLRREARELLRRFPDPLARPLLFGVLVGVKDIFRVEGFPTRAGSQLPPELFAGPEAESVRALRGAGALVLGKTVTTEFAYFEPGPTRNPHNLGHTPGGSSSGSAAAVAAGLCPLALGTQTVGSVNRPAAFCGVVGFKPSYGRIPLEGVIPFSPSADHVGCFTQDVAGMALAASVLCRGWRSGVGEPAARPVLGVPEGPYLQQASPEALAAFEGHLEQLQAAGYPVRRVPALKDIAEVAHRHRRMIAAELAQVHREWFAQYGARYRPRTAGLIREGQEVGLEELQEARRGQQTLRNELEALMQGEGVDLWVCPPALGPAPEGIASTGDPAMNLPWTHAGVPSLTLPAGRTANGLPLGLQVVARFMADEELLAWAEGLAGALGGANR